MTRLHDRLGVALALGAQSARARAGAARLSGTWRLNQAKSSRSARRQHAGHPLPGARLRSSSRANPTSPVLSTSVAAAADLRRLQARWRQGDRAGARGISEDRRRQGGRRKAGRHVAPFVLLAAGDIVVEFKEIWSLDGNALTIEKRARRAENRARRKPSTTRSSWSPGAAIACVVACLDVADRCGCCLPPPPIPSRQPRRRKRPARVVRRICKASGALEPGEIRPRGSRRQTRASRPAEASSSIPLTGGFHYRPEALEKRRATYESAKNRIPWKNADPFVKCYLPGIPRMTVSRMAVSDHPDAQSIV